MDNKLIRYRQIIKQILNRYVELINRHPTPNRETEVVFDEEHDHYMLVNLGWSQKQRIQGNTLHLRLRNGKIWIEEDWTEQGIATDLLEAGIPKEDIVLAFHHPTMRPLTEFAVG